MTVSYIFTELLNKKRLQKYNENHDPRTGRFAPKGGGASGSSSGASSTISSIENEIKGQKHESLAVVSKDGQLLLRKDGTESQVTLSDDDRKKFEGAIVTHNHPGGQRFSDEDIATFVSTKADELRVVTNDGMTCSIRRLDGMEQRGDDLHNAYSRIGFNQKEEDALFDLYMKKIERDGLDPDGEKANSWEYYESVRREFNANWLVENAGKYGYEYSETHSALEKSDRINGCGVLVVEDNKILTGTRIDGKHRNQICGPGGHIEAGETPEEAAVREAYEEFGIECQSLKPLGILDGGRNYGKSAVFLCHEYDGEPQTDEEEMTDIQWRTIDELREERLFWPFEQSLSLLKE